MNKKLKCWAVDYCGITQVYAAETKSRARYMSARALVAAGWTDSTHAALVKLRSWRMPEFDAAAQELGREGAVQCSAGLKPPADKHQELRDQLALTEGRLATLRRIVDGVVAALPYYDEHEHDAATSVKVLVTDLAAAATRAEVADVDRAMLKAEVDTLKGKLHGAVGAIQTFASAMERAEIAEKAQMMLRTEVGKLNQDWRDARRDTEAAEQMVVGFRAEIARLQHLLDLPCAECEAFYEEHDRAERWRDRAVGWMKMNKQHSAAATKWEDKWNNLKRASLTAVDWLLERYENLRGAQQITRPRAQELVALYRRQLAEAKAELAKVQADKTSVLDRVARWKTRAVDWMRACKDATEILERAESGWIDEAKRSRAALDSAVQRGQELEDAVAKAECELKQVNTALDYLRKLESGDAKARTEMIKLMTTVAQQSLEIDALKARIREQRRVLLTAAMFPGDVYSTAAGEEIE